jgi:hypothetical protein
VIALAADCLLFKMGSGESIPFSAEMLSFELMGESATLFDAEFVRHASHAVFDYFKHELNQAEVSIDEFAGALERVLHGFVISARKAAEAESGVMVETDLKRLALESGEGRELFFFPRLREEVSRGLSLSPKLIRLNGLRPCVKQLTGVRRWTPRCTDLQEQIVDFVRHCLSGRSAQDSIAVVLQ